MLYFGSEGVSGSRTGDSLSAFSWGKWPVEEPQVFSLWEMEGPGWGAGGNCPEVLFIKLLVGVGHRIEFTKFSCGREVGYDLETPMTFEESVKELSPMFLRRMLSKGIEDGVAPELVQEVWIKVWKKFGDEIEENSGTIPEKREKHYHGFAYRCAENLRKEKFKQAKLHEKLNLESAAESPQYVEPDWLERHPCFEQIVSAMGEECRTILELKSDGWKSYIIALEIGVKQISVGNKTTRCRKRAHHLKEKFCPDLPFGEMVL